VTEEHIQLLVDRRLLRPKLHVEWRPAEGEVFLTERIDETVVFLAHIVRGFGIPTGDFLRWLLHFYSIELVHLVPNSITIIVTLIHLCEGLPQHHASLPPLAPLLRAEEDGEGCGHL
jgi:hypothetical protein